MTTTPVPVRGVGSEPSLPGVATLACVREVQVELSGYATVLFSFF